MKKQETIIRRRFFDNSDYLDHMVLRPLSHILPNWELTWDKSQGEYKLEEGSFAEILNELLKQLENTVSPSSYHDNEDSLAEYVLVNMNWPIRKQGNRWVGGDYASILEQGGFDDIDEKNLLAAASGRIHTAINFGQNHFDDMETGHREILGSVLSIILYHRAD